MTAIPTAELGLDEARCVCQATIGPPCGGRIRSECSLKRRPVGQGWQGASGLVLFARSRVKIRGPADDPWLDGGCVQQAKATQEELRGRLEAIGGETCFLEYGTFDIGWHGFRISSWLLGLSVVVEVIRPEILQRHVWPPSVVPVLEFGAQKRQVVKPLDERNALEPLALEGLDNAFCDSNGSVFSYGSEAGFDIPLSQQLGKSIPYRNTGLVRDDMFRRPMFLYGAFQGVDDPSGV